MTDPAIRQLVQELFDARIKGLRGEIVARLDAADKAMTLYRTEMHEQMEHLNKVRSEVLLDRGTFVTKAAFESEMDKLTEQAKATWFSIVGWLLTVLAPIVATFVTWAIFRK